RIRGTRKAEVYNNSFDNTGGIEGGGAQYSIVDQRSGVLLSHHNTATNFVLVPFSMRPFNHRLEYLLNPWGEADGTNLWDQNGALNTSGTADSGGALTMTDGDVTFGTVASGGDLRGYVIRKTTAPCNVPIASVDAVTDVFTTSVPHGLTVTTPATAVSLVNHVGSTPNLMGNYTVSAADTTTTFKLTGVNVTTAGTGGTISSKANACSSGITSNTAHTITYHAAFGAPNMTFVAGETYEIRRINQVFDQPSVSGGTNLGGVALPNVLSFTTPQ